MEDGIIFGKMEDKLKINAILTNITAQYRQPDQHNNQKYIGTIKKKSTLLTQYSYAKYMKVFQLKNYTPPPLSPGSEVKIKAEQYSKQTCVCV